MKFPQWLKRHRRKAKLTQSRLAEILGVSRQSINYWEAGKVATFSIKQLQLLLKALGCNTGDLPDE
jgi:transcriptional regulator with XRE-family HTH domain